MTLQEKIDKLPLSIIYNGRKYKLFIVMTADIVRLGYRCGQPIYNAMLMAYHFGIHYYVLFVLADTESNMLRAVNSHPAVRKDEDAEIESYEKIDLTDETNRVL